MQRCTKKAQNIHDQKAIKKLLIFFGSPIIHRIKFDAFFDMDDISDDFEIALFNTDNFDDNLRSGDIAAFDNCFPIYC